EVARWFRLSLSVVRPFRLPVPQYPNRAPFPPPAHRTGREDFPHPALGEGSHFRPRKVGGLLRKTDQTKLAVQRGFREPTGARPADLVLGAQPLTQPFADVLIHRPVGFAH